MSTRRKLVQPDVDIEEAPVGEDIRRWLDTARSGNPSPDYIHLSSISFKQKEPTLSSVVVGRAMQTDDRRVPFTPKDMARRAFRRQYVAQRRFIEYAEYSLINSISEHIFKILAQ